MPYKNPEIARQWRRENKRKMRLERSIMRELLPLHRRLGIETHVHRQAILNDSGGRGMLGLSWSFDPVTRVGPSNHLYRVSVTLAGAA